ncbi:MAG: fibronectin type III domain-containing protein, partial [Desulfobacteraceae bacterium]|nr:fibronectin type III domain-containing protein [Desulfobacteraceae bacterium]
MKLAGTFLIWCSICVAAFAGQQDSQESCASRNCELIFYEGFESGFGPRGWSSTAGLWETCDPRSCPPPDSARSGDSCAATVCCDNISQTTTTSLVGPLLGVPLPSVDTGEFILARWWHCFWIERFNWSSIRFYVRVMGGAWERKWWLEQGIDNPEWTESPIDLTVYAGKTIQFKYEANFSTVVSVRGWYVDDITIERCGLGCYAGADKTICGGASVQFLDAYVQYGVRPYTYSWLPCEGLSDCSILNPIASPESTTTYVLYAQDNVGNECWDTVVVTVLPAPDCSDLSDTTIRMGESIVLDASGMATSYLWSTGETTPSIGFTPLICGDSLVWVQMEGCDQAVTCSLYVHVLDTTRPTDVSATDDRCNVVITWNDNSDCEDGFWIYRDGARIGQVGANITTYTDSPGAGSYSYCIRSYQWTDSSDAGCDQGTALGPTDPPTNVSASDGLCGRVEICWTAPLNATSYNVYRNQSLIGSTSDICYTDGAAQEDVTYSYCVTAVNECGESGSTCDSGWAAASDVAVELSVLSVNRHEKRASLMA